LPAARKTPIVCYVTERKSLDTSGADPNVLVKIRAAIAAGVDWVQIREKDLPARELLELTRAAIRIAAEDAGARARAARKVATDAAPLGVRILVNDRLDVALAAGAAGVHLGGESISVREVARWLSGGNAPTHFSVGVSCHGLEEVRAAQDAGATYAFFGPVFDSPAKRSFGSPQGIARLEEICNSVKMPVLAIGGVNEENAEQCLRAGAAGIAAIRLFQQKDPVQGALKEKISRLHQIS
jgi:thiamine-phosphate pyrophosphorylase